MEPIERAIAAAGGTQAALAGKLGVGIMTVHQWTKRGIPISRCPEIEAALGGAVTCEILNSSVDWVRDTQGRVTHYRVRVDVFGPSGTETSYADVRRCRPPASSAAPIDASDIGA